MRRLFLTLAWMSVLLNIMPNSASPTLTGPQVVVIAYDGLCTFEFGVAYEVFGLPRPEMGSGWYRCRTAAIEPGPLRAAGGLRFEADAGIEALAHADLIIIPGWRSIDAPVPEALIEALRSAHQQGCRIATLCSGAFVLAATGLLDGKRATTHWRYAEALSARFPRIAVEADRLYSDNGNLLTAAGSAAGIDLCLSIVRQDFGVEAANRVARRLVVPPHRDGGQAQFILHPVPRIHEGERLGTIIDWIEANPGSDLSIETLANRAGMSLRSFQRRFAETTGLSAGAHVIRARLRHAQRLMETRRDLKLDEVAILSGFGSVDTMRHHFVKEHQLSPAVWRARFAAPRPNRKGAIEARP
jgi:AraC family transcriptional regulator, transcriptional activator FtrA